MSEQFSGTANATSWLAMGLTALLVVVAAFFSVLNAIVLWVRIREENRALASHR